MLFEPREDIQRIPQSIPVHAAAVITPQEQRLSRDSVLRDSDERLKDVYKQLRNNTPSPNDFREI